MNTGICPIVSVNMYESAIGAMNICDIQLDHEIDEAFRNGLLTEEETKYWDDHAYDTFDTAEYDKHVAECAMELMTDVYTQLFDGKIRVVQSTGSIDSPKWYNFRGDELDFEIDVDDAYFDEIKSALTQDFFVWIKKRYGSYDGFISFMPYLQDDYMKALAGSDRERALAMWMYWVYEQGGEWGTDDDLYDLVSGAGEDPEWTINCIKDERALQIWNKTFDNERAIL